MKHFLLFLTFCLFSSPVLADGEAIPASLTSVQQADLRRIETYLNQFRSLSASFMQVEESGYVRNGWLGIKRPGKMRVNYDLPDKDFIVIDGSSISIWDDALKSQTNLPVDGSVAHLILRENIAFKGDVTVTKFERQPHKIEVTLVATKTPEDGQLTLIFEDNPLVLRQWRVVDPQGNTTGVSLQNLQEDVSFPAGTFNFRPPTFGKSKSLTDK